MGDWKGLARTFGLGAVFEQYGRFVCPARHCDCASQAALRLSGIFLVVKAVDRGLSCRWLEPFFAES